MSKEAALRRAAEAAYNGLCLAAENGEVEDWECKGVDAPLHYPGVGPEGPVAVINLHLRPHGRVHVRMEVRRD